MKTEDEKILQGKLKGTKLKCQHYHLVLIQSNFIQYCYHTNLRSSVRWIIAYSSPHVAQFTAEKLEDVILQHELHLVLVYFFLCGERN